MYKSIYSRPPIFLLMPYKLISEKSEDGFRTYESAVDLFLSKMPEECGLTKYDLTDFVWSLEDDGKYFYVIGEDEKKILIVDGGDTAVDDIVEYLSKSVSERYRENAEERLKNNVIPVIERLGYSCSTIDECEASLLEAVKGLGITPSSIEEAEELLSEEYNNLDDETYRLKRLLEVAKYLDQARQAKNEHERENILRLVSEELGTACDTIQACEKELKAVARRENVSVTSIEELEKKIASKEEKRDLVYYAKQATHELRNARLENTCSVVALRVADEIIAERTAGNTRGRTIGTSLSSRILLSSIPG